MSVVIMGSGNIGSLFGGLLRSTGNEVILIGRSPHMQVVKNKGLQVKTNNVFRVYPYAANGINEADNLLMERKIDYAFITTKAHQTLDAAKELKPYIDEQTVIISMQNGIGTENIVKDVFHCDNVVLRGVTSVGANRPYPGTVVHTGQGKTLIGYSNQKEREHAKKIVEMLNEVSLRAKIENNIKGAVYTKAIVNCALNPIAALNKVRNIEIYKRQSLREASKAIAQEAWNVTKKLGVNLTTTNPITLALEVAKKTGDNINSMLNDILHARRTEIDFLNGVIIQEGLKFDVQVDHNLEAYTKIKNLEALIT